MKNPGDKRRPALKAGEGCLTSNDNIIGVILRSAFSPIRASVEVALRRGAKRSSLNIILVDGMILEFGWRIKM